MGIQRVVRGGVRVGVGLLTAGLLASGGTLSAADPVQVRAVRVSEFRTVETTAPGSKDRLPPPPVGAAAPAAPTPERGHLALVLEVFSPDLAGATHFGKVALSQAALEGGGKLKFKSKLMGADLATGHVPLAPAGAPQAPGQPPPVPGRHLVELGFDPAPRTVGAISEVSGTLEFVVGEDPQEVIVKQLPKVGDAVKDPVLDKAKLKLVRIEPPKEAAVPGATVVAFTLEGSMQKVLEIFAIDAKGQEMQAGWGWEEGGPLPKLMIVVDGVNQTGFGVAMSVVPSQRIVPVPFKTGRLELP